MGTANMIRYIKISGMTYKVRLMHKPDGMYYCVYETHNDPITTDTFSTEVQALREMKKILEDR